MGTWRPITTKPPTLLRISWFWVFFRWIFNVNGYVGNKRSTSVDQNYYHQKGLIVSYKKHFYHFLIRHILFSISSFLCWGYATSPLENLTFISHKNYVNSCVIFVFVVQSTKDDYFFKCMRFPSRNFGHFFGDKFF